MSFIFFNLSSLTANAQTEEYFKSDHLKFAPLCWFNIYKGPNINVVQEHFFKTENPLSLNSSLGVHFPMAYTGWKNLYGGFAKEEIRFYDAQSGFFMGAEISGGWQSYDKTDSLECDIDSTVTYNSKRTWGELSFNIGGIMPFENGFFFEVFFCLGVRYYQNNVSLPTDLADCRFFGDYTVPRHYREKAGSNFAPKITVNIRMSLWRLGQKNV